MLYQPEIPHNTGSVGRTCVAAGAKLWLVRPLGFRLDDYYPAPRGLDYWPHLEWEAVDDWAALCRDCRRRQPYYFTKTADAQLHGRDAISRGDVLVFGNESQGLPAGILEPNRDRAPPNSHPPGGAQLEPVELAWPSSTSKHAASGNRLGACTRAAAKHGD